MRQSQASIIEKVHADCRREQPPAIAATLNVAVGEMIHCNIEMPGSSKGAAWAARCAIIAACLAFELELELELELDAEPMVQGASRLMPAMLDAHAYAGQILSDALAEPRNDYRMTQLLPRLVGVLALVCFRLGSNLGRQIDEQMEVLAQAEPARP